MTVLRAGSATDVGRVRTVNQDMVLVSDTLFAVADGMGGHAGGEVAAEVAVEALQSAFAKDRTAQGLEHALIEANAAVWERSQHDSELRGMGTTMTAVALVAGRDGQDVLALANVGDSRAYVWSNGHLDQVTKDHSLAEEKFRRGEITEAEAAAHPHRHILTRALGIGTGVAVDLWELRVQTADRVLLCSDGLTNEVSPEQMAAVLGTLPDATAAAAALVRLANESGGSDNITVVVVDVLVGEDGGGTVATPLLGSVAGPSTVLGGGGSEEEKSDPVSSSATPGRDSQARGGDLGPAGADDTMAVVGLVDPRSPAEPPAGASLPTLVGGRAEQVDDRADEAAQLATGTATATMRTVAPDRATGDQAAGSSAGPVGVAGRRGPDRRRQDDRRRDAPRLITLRVVLFALLFVGVLAGGYEFVKWYAGDSWYVTTDHAELVVYQGRPGGLLWFHPKIVDRTGVTTAEVLPVRLPALHADVIEPSLASSKQYVANLQNEFTSQQAAAIGGAVPTTAPPVPSTTAPGSVPAGPLVPPPTGPAIAPSTAGAP